MKPLILASLLTLTTTAHAVEPRRVFHCQAQCVALNGACGSSAEGTVHGFSRRGKRRAFNDMLAQCNGRAGGLGILLSSIDGFRMESSSHMVTEETSEVYPHWNQWVVSWATNCAFEIHGNPALQSDADTCWREREDEIDVPYSGTQPVRG